MSSRSATANAGLSPAWGKGALLVAALFISCWGAAILYWRMTDRMPGMGELALCLVGAPLLISGGICLSRKMLEQPAATSSSVPVAGDATSAAASALVILDTALRLPCGSSPDGVARAVKTNKARPNLDRELLDDDGFPVMTARCALADDRNERGVIEEWVTANGFAGAGFVDEQWRALVLATQVVRELSVHADAGQALHVLPIVPEDWTSTQRRASASWLVHTIGQPGWSKDRVALVPEAPGDQHLATTLAGLAKADAAPALTMLIAFTSNVGDRTIARWSEDKTLFRSANPNGRIPGEGSVGMLVTRSQERPSDRATKCAALLSVAETPLENDGGDSRRADHATLVNLASSACAHAKVEHAQVAAIVSDAGHAPDRVIELLRIASALSPQLENAEDMLNIGIATGSCGAVQSLAALALACHCAVDQQKPIVWASNEDPLWRAAAVITPAYLAVAGA